jgi:hypothetical protein
VLENEERLVLAGEKEKLLELADKVAFELNHQQIQLTFIGHFRSSLMFISEG